MTGPEAERQYYLAMAGIQLWYAREPLPGSAPSPDFEFPEEPATNESVVEAVPGNPAPPRRETRPRTMVDSAQAGERIAHLQAMMSGVRQKKADKGQPEATVEAEVAVGLPEGEPAAVENLPEPPASASNLRVTLGFWAAGNVLLVSGISEDASERLQDTLANNILSALGQAKAVKPTLLRWPVFSNTLVPGNSTADFVQLVDSLVEKSGRKHLVLLGVLQDWSPEDRAPLVAQALGKPVVDFPNRLAELAAVPAYKRALWSELKPWAREGRD